MALETGTFFIEVAERAWREGLTAAVDRRYADDERDCRVPDELADLRDLVVFRIGTVGVETGVWRWRGARSRARRRGAH